MGAVRLLKNVSLHVCCGPRETVVKRLGGEGGGIRLVEQRSQALEGGVGGLGRQVAAHDSEVGLGTANARLVEELIEIHPLEVGFLEAPEEGTQGVLRLDVLVG